MKITEREEEGKGEKRLKENKAIEKKGRREKGKEAWNTANKIRKEK